MFAVDKEFWIKLRGYTPRKMPFEMRYVKYMRHVSQSKGLFKFFYRFMFKWYKMFSSIQISPTTKIGSGFVIGHKGTIVINPEAVIGNYVTLGVGVVIGADFRGKRAGVPIIGNYVAIHSNSVIVGKIIIGDDVLIAPNTFVNFDVPSHSIVIGNPAKIINRNWATEGHIPLMEGKDE